MPQTTQGLTYPDSAGHTRLWEHIQQLAEDVDALVGPNRTQSGEAELPFATTTTANVAVVFDEPFSAPPKVTVTAGNVAINCSWSAVTATGFTAYGRRLEGATQGSPVTVHWQAHGPR